MVVWRQPTLKLYLLAVVVFSGAELHVTSLLLSTRFYFSVYDDVTAYRSCADSGIYPLALSFWHSGPLAPWPLGPGSTIL